VSRRTHVMTIFGHRSLCMMFIVALAAFPAFAQQQPQPSDPRVTDLEKKLDELLRQAAEIRQQLDSMKGAPAPAPAPAQPETDLTKVDVANPTAPTSTETPAKETPPPALTDVQT